MKSKFPMLRKKIIYGCEGRGDGINPYLTRYTIFSLPFLKIYIHVFHRSDAEDLHDHPWAFLSILLWRGYIEQTPAGKQRKYPGMIIFRKAKHLHRVEVINNKKAVTIVFVGRRVRDWGFMVGGIWRQWQKYFIEKKC